MQGDAFLARVFDNEDDFERLDFTLKEVTKQRSLGERSCRAE